MDGLERFDVAVDVALVDALHGAAVGEKMLGGRRDMTLAEKFRRALAALQPLDQRRAERCDDPRIFGIAFVSPAPAVVPRDGDGGREVPVDAGRRDLHRGCRADPAEQVGITRRAQTDIVREDRRADDVGVAVDRVGAPDGRDDRLATGHRPRRSEIHLVGEAQPLRAGSEFVAIGAAIAAVEIGAEAIARHVLGSEAVDLRLDELGDLALDAHAGEIVGNHGIFAGDIYHDRSFRFGTVIDSRAPRKADSHDSRKRSAPEAAEASLVHPNPFPQFI